MSIETHKEARELAESVWDVGHLPEGWSDVTIIVERIIALVRKQCAQSLMQEAISVEGDRMLSTRTTMTRSAAANRMRQFAIAIQGKAADTERERILKQVAKRPPNYYLMSPEEQWAIDKELGILDWDERGL